MKTELTHRAARALRWSLILAGAIGLGACGGGSGGGGGDGGGGTDSGGGGVAQFTVGGDTQVFATSECNVSAGGTFNQLMCAHPGGTPAINMVVQAPPDVGTYDSSNPNVAISVVDPTVSAQVQCGTCSVVVTGTAAPGQGAWQGHFDVQGIDATASGTFDVQVSQ